MTLLKYCFYTIEYLIFYGRISNSPTISDFGEIRKQHRLPSENFRPTWIIIPRLVFCANHRYRFKLIKINNFWPMKSSNALNLSYSSVTIINELNFKHCWMKTSPILTIILVLELCLCLHTKLTLQRSATRTVLKIILNTDV